MTIHNAQEYLFRESLTISGLIATECGVSQKLMDYLSSKSYTFEYKDDNPTAVGEIVYYELNENIKTFYAKTKQINLVQSVILGDLSL